MWTLLLTALTALLWLAITLLGNDLGTSENTLRLAAFGLSMLVGVRIVHTLVINALISAKVNRGYITSDLLRAVLAVVLYTLGFLFFLRTVLHVDVSSVLATSAMLSAIIGLALQPTLGHLFSGVSIELERPVRIGDFVSRGTLEGRIISLTWRAVHLVTERGARVVVPNSEFTSQPIEVIPQDQPYRMQANFAVGSQFPPGQVMRIAMQVVRSGLPAICLEPSPSVVMVDNDSVSGVIRYSIRFYTFEFLSRSSTASNFLERLWYALGREGIELPQPPFHWLALKQENGPVPMHTLFSNDLSHPSPITHTIREPGSVSAEVMQGIPDALRNALILCARHVRFAQDEHCEGFGIALMLRGAVRESTPLSANQRDVAVARLLDELANIATDFPPVKMSEGVFQSLLQASTLALGPLAYALCQRIASLTEDPYLAYHAIARSIQGDAARARFLALSPTHAIHTLHSNDWLGWGETRSSTPQAEHCHAVQDCSMLSWQPSALAACLADANEEALSAFLAHLNLHSRQASGWTLDDLRGWIARPIASLPAAPARNTESGH